MPSFFSVRLAPGVRVSASSRGLRAHVGPRAARLHVGGGRTGVSTGAGPFTYYTSGGGGTSPRRATYRSGPTQAQIARAQKEEQAGLICAWIDDVQRLHRQEFEPLRKRVAAPPPVLPFADLLREEEKRALAGIGWFARAERRDAKAAARDRAEARARELMQQAQVAQAQEQDRLDRLWTRILANEEEVVLPLLAAAFADNEAPVAAVGTTGSDVAITVLVPGEQALPDRVPTRTPAGNLSLRKATKTQQAEWYRQLVAGHVLVSVRETLAMASGAASVTVVAVRQGYGIEALFGGRFLRSSLARAPFDTQDAWAILRHEALDQRVMTRGAPQALVPLELSEEPELRELVGAFDVEAPAG